MFYSSDEVSHILYFIVQSGLENLKNVSKSDFIEQTKSLKMRKNIFTYISQRIHNIENSSKWDLLCGTNANFEKRVLCFSSMIYSSTTQSKNSAALILFVKRLSVFVIRCELVKGILDFMHFQVASHTLVNTNLLTMFG